MISFTKHIILFTTLLLLNTIAVGQNVLIKVYNDKKISSIKLRVELGEYKVIGNKNDTLFKKKSFTKGDVFEIKIHNSNINLKHNNQHIGNYSSLKFQGKGFKNIFSILPTSGAEKRTYDDNLIIKPNSGNLSLLNDVEPENYIAGVVQSEIYGKPELIDIFKVQAIISRTYALRNVNKHKNEGFNLCDGVHCQVYANRCIKPEVLEGAIKSKGEILVDSSNLLIDAPFHSNSGGQTINSEDVWSKPVPYLRGKVDTFSLQMKNTTWTKNFSINEWLNYFSKTHSLDIKNDSIKNELLNFTQDERKTSICSVPLKTIRSDLKLRSTFFSVVQKDSNNITLQGKGFGHGVGLSQEGAIRMVELGFNYKDILLFYYNGINVLYVDEEKEIQKSDITNNISQ